MLCILPFEPKAYEGTGVAATVDALKALLPAEAAARMPVDLGGDATPERTLQVTQQAVQRAQALGFDAVATGLGVLLVAILLIHSPNYWKWFLIGGTGYLLDRALRFYRMRRPSHLVTTRVLPSRKCSVQSSLPALGL